MSAVELGEESIEAIARRVVELLEPTPKLARGLVDAATVARELGTSRDFVFRHKRELGARRLGNGPKGRLRFDLATARAAYDELRAVPEPLSPTKPARKTPKRRQPRASVPLLPVKAP